MDETIEQTAEQVEQQAEPSLSELLDAQGSEPSDEAGEQAQEAEEVEQKPEPESDPDLAVHKLDNGREVSLGELKKSFADFTQKNARLDNERRQTVEQARNAVANVAEQYANQAHLLARQVLQLVAPGIDEQQLARLASEDPASYHAARARLDMAQRLQQDISAHASRLAQQAQQQRETAKTEAAQARQQLLDSEAQRLAGHKWWNADFAAKATSYATRHGIPREVAESVAHAGFVEITRKAMLYDEAMAKTKQGKQPPSQPQIKPGTTGKVNGVKEIRGLMDRARKTHDTTDIGRVLSKLI